MPQPLVQETVFCLIREDFTKGVTLWSFQHKKRYESGHAECPVRRPCWRSENCASGRWARLTEPNEDADRRQAGGEVWQLGPMTWGLDLIPEESRLSWVVGQVGDKVGVLSDQP